MIDSGGLIARGSESRTLTGFVYAGVDYNNPILGGCFGPGCHVEIGYDLVGDDFSGENKPTPDSDPCSSLVPRPSQLLLTLSILKTLTVTRMELASPGSSERSRTSTGFQGLPPKRRWACFG